MLSINSLGVAASALHNRLQQRAGVANQGAGQRWAIVLWMGAGWLEQFETEQPQQQRRRLQQLMSCRTLEIWWYLLVRTYTLLFQLILSLIVQPYALIISWSLPQIVTEPCREVWNKNAVLCLEPWPVTVPKSSATNFTLPTASCDASSFGLETDRPGNRACRRHPASSTVAWTKTLKSCMRLPFAPCRRAPQLMKSWALSMLSTLISTLGLWRWLEDVATPGVAMGTLNYGSVRIYEEQRTARLSSMRRLRHVSLCLNKRINPQACLMKR
jgi:hypothetical protein